MLPVIMSSENVPTGAFCFALFACERFAYVPLLVDLQVILGAEIKSALRVSASMSRLREFGWVCRPAT